MKKTLFVCCALALALGAQAQWKPVGDKIKTPVVGTGKSGECPS